MTPTAQPAGVLAIDVGAGTSDILLTRPGQPLENAVKLVVPSATQVTGARIAAATARGQTVVFRGPVMGGGAVTMAMKAHLAAGHAFVTTESAAASFADDLDKVRALGARVVGEGAADEVLRRLPDGAAAEVASGDLDAAALTGALRLLGAEPTFSAVAVAVQDHGYAPDGSNRVLRFSLWERAVTERRLIGDLFYDTVAVPPALTRLRTAADGAAALAGAAPALVADTGPAALYGALPDGIDDAVLVNIGNGHTVCLLAREGRVAGVFEHHTSCLDRRRPRTAPAALAGRRPGQRRGPRRPRPRRRARARRRRRRPLPPAAHRHRARAAGCSPAASCRPNSRRRTAT